MSQPQTPTGSPATKNRKPRKRLYGTVIRQKRERAGLSQEDMAQLLNMSHNGYWKIENDDTKLTAETLEDIAAIVKTDAAEFLQEDYSKYRIKQTNYNHDQSSGLIINKYEFEAERKVWDGYVQSQKETIEAKNQALIAKDALIAAKEETIEALRISMKTS